MCNNNIIFSSLAREAIRHLREEEKVAPSLEYHHRFCSFVKTAKFTLEEKPKEEKKKEGAKEGGKEKGSKKQKK